MRMRFKPYARPELLACSFHVHEPLAQAGRWRALYPAPEKPFCLELGCGKAASWPGWPASTPKTTTWASTSPTRC